jgi:hypothetical protein
MSILNVYINRAGRALSPERRRILERAKSERRSDGVVTASIHPVPLSHGSEVARGLAVYDTTRIRVELGYSEPVSYEEGLRRTLAGRSTLAY